MRLTAVAKIVLVTLCSLVPCLGQADIPHRIDNLVTLEMRTRQIPGVAVAVVRNGKISILKTYGLANVEHQVPVTPKTIFQSGSVGKQFTAAAVMILVQEGKLSLEDKVSRYLPDIPNSWSDITVRHLLTHTSGLGDYPPEIDLRRDYTEEQLLEYFKKAPLTFRPGEKWDYSNAGYVTLGILIRKVTGRFYGDILRERIFEPLGMTTARVISEADIIPNRAAGYRVVANEVKNQEWVSPSTNSTADGALYLSILDLMKWDAALYRDHPLKQTTLAQAWQPVALNSGVRKGYGFGWFTAHFHNQRVVFHGGFWQGFKSCIVRFPDDKLTIIVLANSSNTREFKLARGLVALYFPKFRIPREHAIAKPEPKATGLMRRFLLQLSSGSFEKSLTTSHLAEELTPARVKEYADRLNSLTLPIAIIHSEELIEHRDENGLRVYRYLFNDIPRTLSLTLKLTKDDLIAGFELAEMKLN